MFYSEIRDGIKGLKDKIVMGCDADLRVKFSSHLL